MALSTRQTVRGVIQDLPGLISKPSTLSVQSLRFPDVAGDEGDLCAAIACCADILGKEGRPEELSCDRLPQGLYWLTP